MKGQYIRILNSWKEETKALTDAEKEKVGKKIMVRCKLDGSLHNRCRIDCPHLRYTWAVRLRRYMGAWTEHT